MPDTTSPREDERRSGEPEGVADDPGQRVGGDIQATIEATRGQGEPGVVVQPAPAERTPAPPHGGNVPGDPSDTGAPAG